MMKRIILFAGMPGPRRAGHPQHSPLYHATASSWIS
jgi:hypothetical protein